MPTAALIGGAAYGGWKIGSWIDQSTGLSQSVGQLVENIGSRGLDEPNYDLLRRVWLANDDVGRMELENGYPFLQQFGRLMRTYHPDDIEVHHMFPQALSVWFSSRGINIHEARFCRPMFKISHRIGFHGMGSTDQFENEWVNRWRDFQRQNRYATKAQIYGFLGRMMQLYGVR